MIQIALISHGAFCEGLIDTLKMVSGDDFGVRTLSLVPGTAPDTYRESLSQILDELSAKDDRGVLVLTDIAGGTPFNSAVYLRSKYKLGIVSGVNVPMLMTLAIERTEDDTIDTLLEKAQQPLAVGVKVVSPNDTEKRKRAKLSAHAH